MTHASSAAVRRRRDLGNSQSAFLVPAALVVFLLSAFPLAFSLGMTLTNWNLGIREISFTGLDNWARLLADPAFLTAAKNTLFFVVAGLVLQYAIGLALALLVMEARRGQNFFRVVFLLPMMMSPIAISFIVGQMILSESIGPVAGLLSALGIGHVGWVTDPALAPWTIVLVDTWHWSAFVFIVLLAGLQAIPEETIEAAKVDGASAWRVLWSIRLPMLLPITVTVIFIRGLELFRMIETVRVVTNGGPGEVTRTLSLLVYDVSLRRSEVAYGATIAYGLVILVILFSIVYLALTRRAVERVT